MPSGERHGDDAVPTGDRDRGQATVELAMSLPILAVVLLAVAQIAVAVRNELAVELAAREGARAAAVAADSSAAARDAATGATRLPIDVETHRGAELVTVTVSYVDPTDVAIIGRFIGPIEHRAVVTMALEPP